MSSYVDAYRDLQAGVASATRRGRAIKRTLEDMYRGGEDVKVDPDILAQIKLAKIGKQFIQKRGQDRLVDGGVREHGTMRTRTRRRKRKKRKKSMKQIVKSLKRVIPKTSTKLFRDFEMLCMSASGPNQRRIYCIEGFQVPMYTNYISNLTAVDSAGTVDYSTTKTKVKMDQYAKLHCRNNSTGLVHVAYAWMICKDDDNESPLTCIREELLARGYDIKNQPIDPKSAKTATRSAIPKRFLLDATDDGIFGQRPYHVPVFGGGALRRKYRQVGAVQYTTMGPGDTIDIKWSRKNYTWNQERKDEEEFTNLSGATVYLLMDLKGDLVHDDTNTCLIGYSSYQLDCEMQRSCMVRYANPKGLREVVYTQDFPTDENLTVQQMAVDQDAKLVTPQE